MSVALRLPFEGLVALGTTIVDDVTRARAFVAHRRARGVCARCCGDERLQFVHRRVSPWNAPVWRLVAMGASLARIREEMARCDVVCRRCWVSGVHPHMLRASKTGSVPVVAKVAITSGRGRKGADGHSRERAGGC